MTDSEHRLDRLYPALTARERGILVLRAWKEGREEDPQIRRTMPQEQIEEFNHHINLLTYVNRELTAYAVLVRQLIAGLRLRFAWLLSLGLLGEISPDTEWLAETLIETLRDGLQGRWQELRAAEKVVEEATARFGGEDAAGSLLRQLVEESRAKLEELRREAEPHIGSLDLPEPTEEFLADVRGIVQRAEKLYGSAAC